MKQSCGRIRLLTVGSIVSLTVILVTAGLVFNDLPFWRAGGTLSAHVTSVSYASGASLCPGEGESVELRGDSLVIGSRMGSEKGVPYGIVTERVLGKERRFVLLGKGGATAADGAALWQARPVESSIVLLAFGTNDAASRGWIGRKRPVPIEDFRSSLENHLQAIKRRGAQPALIAPPPVGSTAMSRRLHPYRLAVGEVGRETGVTVLDPADAFAECRALEPLLSYDALHLNQRGHNCLGKWLASRLCPLPKTQEKPDRRKTTFLQVTYLAHQ